MKTTSAFKLITATAVAALSAATAAFSADPESCSTVHLSDIGWTDVTSTTATAALLLKKLGYETDIKVLSLPVTYTSMKNKDIDVFLGNWMQSQKADIQPYLDDKSVESYGPNLVGAKYTLATNAKGAELGIKDFKDIAAHKDELDGKTITHDFNKFWEMMRREKGSTRPPLTEEQRRRKPPVAHPVFLTHPITGRKVLYANPGYSMRINELPVERSEQVLDFLFKHQLQEKYRYRHRWTQKDVLMWDNMGTIHNAVADYRPDEPRLIKRCQVMADRYFQQ